MAIVKINDLGKFADLNAVWHSHPEGGREGDYLRIGNDEYMWDKYERDWKTTSSGSGDHTPEGGVVDGDLTVGGNLHVGGDADIEGTLTVGDIRIGNGDRFKGQSTYKSIVFKRANARPSKPAAWDGSFSNPVPSGGWSDGVPAGNTPIWMTSRIFTSDGNAPQEDAWNDVVLMSDAENFDVEFSMAGTDTVPAAPTPNNLGYLWFDPVRDAGNANAHWDRMNWMATRTKSTDASGSAVWSDWTIVLIKGESGDGTQSVYKVTDGSTPSISGTSYPPSGWSVSVDSLTVGTGDVLWMSDRRFTNGAWSAWSSPVRISGEDGEAGKDATNIEFIYKRMNRLPNTDGNTDTAPESVDADGSVPIYEGWNDHPSGVDAEHKYEWMCQRIKPQGEGWGNWNGPFVWSAFGVSGMDGDGVEYVFKLTTTNAAPSTPSTANGEVIPSGEFIPAGWTDAPTGVSKGNPYEWVSIRKKINGTWGAFKTPALWACYSEEHTVTISENGYWVIDGVETDKMAIGTGVTIKGRVDVYRDNEAQPGQTSLESYPISLGTLEIGDCWIVENGATSGGDDVSGHLFICVATTGTLQSMWNDLGEFKGEPGESSYLRIAWAEKIVFSPSFNATYPTTDPAVGRNYDWMGIKVTKSENQAVAWSDYKWNYLRGKDGMDVEYVYIRTKVNVAPKITEAADQSQEHLPKVSNYSTEYQSVDEIDGDEFFDDPKGVEENWPYEWMSKRERVDGVWQTFLTPARLWAKWGEQGESVATVKTEPALVAIPADPDGRVSSLYNVVVVKAWLYYGDSKEIPILGNCSAVYNARPVSIDQRQTINPNDPYVVIRLTLSTATPLTNSDLRITLANNKHSATTTVPIVINRQGATGQSVFRSTVFRYYEPTQANPVPSAPTGGDYFHPADVDDSSVWSDGIPATGSGPLWMSHRLFTSDGQAPQESTWSTPILAQDIDNSMDVEYSPNALDDIPGVPDGTNQEGSGQIWFDRKRDASNPNADWSAMNWMAIRIREVNAGGYPEWGNWVITQIRGEKGDDGAGQAYVAPSIDHVVVDCGADGRPKAAVNKTFTARLMWGDEECELITRDCSVSVDTAGTIQTNYVSEGQGSSITKAEINYSITAQGIGTPQLPVLTSGLITITLVGTDSNSVEHVATKTVPIYANQQGETGNSGPVLRFRGAWSGSESYTYNDIFRDCVKYNGLYWVLSDRHDGTTSAPNADDTWTSIGNMNFVATDLLLSEQATIHNLIADKVKTAPTGARVEMYGNKAEFYGTLSFPSIELFVDNEGVGCLRFYDVNHNAVIEIGPRGMNWLVTVVEAKFSSAYYVKMTNDTPDKSGSTTGQVPLYQFTARRANGVITGSSQTDGSADIAAQADGKYFTSTPIYSNGALNSNLLANGLYRSSSASIFQYQPSIGKYTDIDEMKAEFMANYSLTEAQADIFTWSLDNSPIPKLATPINILAFLKFVAGVPYTVLHFWQGSNNDLVIGLD